MTFHEAHQSFLLIFLVGFGCVLYLFNSLYIPKELLNPPRQLVELAVAADAKALAVATAGPLVFASPIWTASMPLPSVDTERVPGRRMPALPPVVWASWESPPVELRGQVTLQTSFGQELHRIAMLPEVHLVLEIGTWYGGGSSWCIAQGLRVNTVDAARPDRWLFTLELFDDAWRYAAETLQRLPVTCMKAGTVGIEGYLGRDQMTRADLSSEHFALYYGRDLLLAGQPENRPMLQALCQAYDFDFVLIDGNEYTGLAEFTLVDALCRPKYLALHDTGTLKTRRVEEILSSSPSWSKMSSGVDGAGWAVYFSTR